MAIADALPRKKPSLLRQLGPGLITGASDDDPGGIATYSQVGAQFGYQMLWTAWFLYPLMGGIQEICARIGRVTGHGIAGNIRRHHSPWLLYGTVALLLLANVINLGADIGAMGAALHLLIGGPMLLYAALFAIVSVLLQVFMHFESYTRVLKWLTLALFAYVGTAFAIRIDWGQVLHGFLVPTVIFRSDYLMGLVALFGTTISPYLFFWQASQEVETQRETPGEEALRKAPRQAPAQLQRIRIDTYVGMAFSNLIAFFIMLTAAATLHAHGGTQIQTATQAAEALRPVAGQFAFLLFSLGIIGTGLLAVPVLAGSAAYAVGEALKWPVGLARRPLEAKGFYGIIAAATFVGVGFDFLDINPIQALYLSAVLNGLVAVPIMVLMMRMAMRPKIMGRFVLPPRLLIVGWLATAVMAAAAVALILNWLA
ncbi:divalent metal cation transporter [Thermithiobacillus tepidarius DSM 3134]|uniref:NRAMP family divalent metal transporter n=1 Tax=Thermithiobacillus tepidarius TaxID=929 RepID=UPI0004243593|nr:divalent metal cation transporter [Thermithiobacillus tepidarius]